MTVKYDIIDIRFNKNNKAILYLPELFYQEDKERLLSFIQLVSPSQRRITKEKIG